MKRIPALLSAMVMSACAANLTTGQAEAGVAPVAGAHAEAQASVPAEQSWREASEHPRRIVFQNRYYAKPGKTEEVYQWRVHASDVLEQNGIPRGEIFRGPGGDQPDVIWQLELEPAAAERAVKRQAEVMNQFEPIMEHMGTLIRLFESSRYIEVRYREAQR
jgi:hypothetical protein